MNLIFEHLVQVPQLALAVASLPIQASAKGFFPQSNISTSSKMNRSEEKNAPGTAGLLRNSCTAAPGESTMPGKAPGEQREQNQGITFGEDPALSPFHAIFAEVC